MRGIPWDDPQELADLDNLSQAQFLAKYPHRTPRSYACRMHKMGKKIGEHDVLVKVQNKYEYLSETIAQQSPDPDKLLDLMKQLQAEQRKLISINRDVHVQINTEHPIGIVFTADWHIGSEGTDYQQLERDIELIHSNPYLYAYVGGDAIDNFILQKMIAASRSQLVTPPVQWYLFEQFLQKMNGSILAVGAGNHDNWSVQMAAIDRVADIAKRLNVVYTGQGGMLNLTVGSQTYKIFRRHKFRYNSSLNILNSVKRMYDMGPDSWDVGVIEHWHVGGAEIFMKHGRNRVAIVVGTYKVFDQWAVDMGFYGSQVMNPVVVFWPNEFRYELRMDLQAAAQELNRGG